MGGEHPGRVGITVVELDHRLHPPAAPRARCPPSRSRPPSGLRRHPFPTPRARPRRPRMGFASPTSPDVTTTSKTSGNPWSRRSRRTSAAGSGRAVTMPIRKPLAASLATVGAASAQGGHIEVAQGDVYRGSDRGARFLSHRDAAFRESLGPEPRAVEPAPLPWIRRRRDHSDDPTLAQICRTSSAASSCASPSRPSCGSICAAWRAVIVSQSGRGPTSQSVRSRSKSTA